MVDTGADAKADKPGLLDRLKARFPIIARVLLAQERYTDAKGDFFAAGITYFTVFALFPMIMVGFAAGAFALALRPELMQEVEQKIRTSVSGDISVQLINLMDSAISSRTSVGVIGLATAAWAGLGWMNNLREALSEMWTQRRSQRNYVVTKLSDLAALLSLFVALLFTVALSALSSSSLMTKVLDLIGIPHFWGLAGALRAVSLLASLGVSWLLFTWVIARLPRESVSFRSSVRAGAIAAVGFEVFKQVASLYLTRVLHGPAGATFGPVLGLMVFSYITSRLVLFSAAWAATEPDNLAAAPVDPPDPAVIRPRLQVRDGLGPAGVLAAAAVGVAGTLGVLRFWRR